ncbi:MAG TPA: hypothetical protein VLL03_05975 [Burkholderiales bacterium]|nr:hypothetical protein [Burkholderiales bacterium]
MPQQALGFLMLKAGGAQDQGLRRAKGRTISGHQMHAVEKRLARFPSFPRRVRQF